MKTSVLNRNSISPEVAGLITRLVSLIPMASTTPSYGRCRADNIGRQASDCRK